MEDMENEHLRPVESVLGIHGACIRLRDNGESNVGLYKSCLEMSTKIMFLRLSCIVGPTHSRARILGLTSTVTLNPKPSNLNPENLNSYRRNQSLTAVRLEQRYEFQVSFLVVTYRCLNGSGGVNRGPSIGDTMGNIVG